MPSTPARIPYGTPFSQAAAAAGLTPNEFPIANNPSPDNSSGPFLSVASFNLLAPCYVRPIDKRTGGIQPFAAFEWISDTDTPEVLDITKRGPRLLAALRECRADVLCLQELQLFRSGDESNNDELQFELPSWLKPITEEDVYAICLPPLAELEEMADRNQRVLGVDAPVTTALMYRTDRLERCNEGASLNKKDGEDTSTCVTACFRGKDQSGLQNVRRPFVVSSIHLDATSEVKRVGQISRCLRRARASIQQSESSDDDLGFPSTLIAGDMNTEIRRGSCVSAYFVGESTDPPSNDEISKECASALRLPPGSAPSESQIEEWMQLYNEASSTSYEQCVKLERLKTGATRAAYDHGADEKEPGETLSESFPSLPSLPAGKGTMASWKLDHIAFTTRTFRPLVFWSSLESDQDSLASGLPNYRIPSDHLPIGGLFEVLPPPTLGEEQRVSLIENVRSLSKKQSFDLKNLEVSFDEELQIIESRILQSAPAIDTAVSLEAQVADNNKKQRKKKKKGPPPQEIIECMRRKRSSVKELKAKQVAERETLAKTLDEVYRLAFAKFLGCSVSQWIERGDGAITINT